MLSGSIAFVAVHSAGRVGGVTLSKPSAKTVICWALHDGNGGVAVGVAVAVGVGLPDRAQYLPPVFK